MAGRQVLFICTGVPRSAGFGQWSAAQDVAAHHDAEHLEHIAVVVVERFLFGGCLPKRRADGLAF